MKCAQSWLLAGELGIYLLVHANLGDEETRVCMAFLRLMERMQSKDLDKDPDELEEIERLIPIVMGEMELMLPTQLMTMARHAFGHLPADIRRHGPLHRWAMWVFERYNKLLKQMTPG